MVKKIWVLGLALILLVSVLGRWTSAQSVTALESRIARLESDSFQLRSEISRIESQVYQLANRSGSGAPRPPSPLPPASPRVTRPVPRAEPTFDRLATLVIELKERVTNLEKRVNKLDR